MLAKNINLCLGVFLSIVAISMICSEPLIAKSYRESQFLRSGVIDTIIVTSKMQCLHKCKRAPRCRGINVEKREEDLVLCELTTADASEANLETNHGWEFYSIGQEKKVYDVKAVSYAMQDNASAGDPVALSKIVVNGIGIGVAKGFTILVFDFHQGIKNDRIVRRFFGNSRMTDMATFLQSIKQGKILIIIVADTGVETSGDVLPDPLQAALKEVGAKQLEMKYRMPYCLVTMVKVNVKWQREVLQNNTEGPSVCETVIY